MNRVAEVSYTLVTRELGSPKKAALQTLDPGNKQQNVLSFFFLLMLCAPVGGNARIHEGVFLDDDHHGDYHHHLRQNLSSRRDQTFAGSTFSALGLKVCTTTPDSTLLLRQSLSLNMDLSNSARVAEQ